MKAITKAIMQEINVLRSLNSLSLIYVWNWTKKVSKLYWADKLGIWVNVAIVYSGKVTSVEKSGCYDKSLMH